MIICGAQRKESELKNIPITRNKGRSTGMPETMKKTSGVNLFNFLNADLTEFEEIDILEKFIIPTVLYIGCLL